MAGSGSGPVGVKTVGWGFLFRALGLWLVLRGLVALIMLVLRPFSAGYLAEVVSIYGLFVVGGFGIFMDCMWGVWLSGVGIFMALGIDLLSSSPNMFIDAVYVFLLAALAGHSRNK